MIRTVKKEQVKLGLKIAGCLRHSWRESPAAVVIDDDGLEKVMHALSHSGAPALAWWRVRNTPLAETELGHQLHEAYRRFRLSARVHEQEIVNIFTRLRDAGIEPVLVKGWAIARRYPDPGLRPYGDIDICVRPDQYEHAKTALKYFESVDGHYFDLHQGIDSVGRGNLERPLPLGEGWGEGFRRALQALTLSLSQKERAESGVSEARALARATFHPGSVESNGALLHGRASDTWDEVFARTKLVPIRDAPSPLGEGNEVRVARTMVRVLSDEDHLRVLCHHFLLSGAWRPLWLVDVAVALETASEDFDWNICLGMAGSGKRKEASVTRDANWVMVTVALAQQLLNAGVRGKGEGGRECERGPATGDRGDHLSSAFGQFYTQHPTTYTLPRWLTAALLRQWGRCQNPSTVKGTLPTLMKLRSQPRELLREIYARWDHPIRSTAAIDGRFNNWPRAPYQLIDQLMRMRAELPKQMRTVWKTARGSGSQFGVRNPQFD